LLLYQGKRWDAIIYYRKAEKLLERSPIGQEAKFKRAKAAYYVGDFQWSQGIFKILKESTSKLIANDAMQYSLLITDNMALDSTTEALETYAKADLLFYREKLDSALYYLALFDVAFPEHPILDEALLMKGDIYFKQKNFAEAERAWQKIVADHSKGILADDALYRLANLQINQFANSEKAMEYFEKIFIEYSDSFYAAEARNSYRNLRGDQLN
jgi:TolA-binding protein